MGFLFWLWFVVVVWLWSGCGFHGFCWWTIRFSEGSVWVLWLFGFDWVTVLGFGWSTISCLVKWRFVVCTLVKTFLLCFTLEHQSPCALRNVMLSELFINSFASISKICFGFSFPSIDPSHDSVIKVAQV